MKFPFLFSRYCCNQFLASLLLLLGTFSATILLFDFIEMLRRTFQKSLPLALIFEMAVLHLPYLLIHLFPFITMLAGILSFSRMTKRNELVIARAVGLSAWQFVSPAIFTSILLGIFIMTILNPLTSVMLTRLEHLENKHLRESSGSMMAISPSGLWLKERNPTNNIILHAARVSTDAAKLFDVTFYLFSRDNKFTQRIDATETNLEQGYWNLKEVLFTKPGSQGMRKSTYRLPTSLSKHQLQESFAPPEAVSFWQLPHFIKTLKTAGFSAIKHRLHWYNLLALPLYLSGMTLLGATFGLRHVRQGKIGAMMTTGIIIGFILYFLADIVAALGLSGKISIVVSACIPSILSGLLGISLLLHLEDG